jgi:hypothetical protein
MAAGWAHYLTFDLFVGRWILFDSIKNRVFAAHSLVLANLFGPVGLLSHLVRPPSSLQLASLRRRRLAPAQSPTMAAHRSLAIAGPCGVVGEGRGLTAHAGAVRL